MKALLSLSLIILLSPLSQAATCNELFSDGSIEYSYASRAFEDGNVYYNEALEESKKPNPDSEILCHKLFLSSSGFNYSANGFRNCAGIFLSAMSVCSGTDKITASKHKNTCLSNKEVSDSNFNYVYNEYKRLCRQ